VRADDDGGFDQTSAAALRLAPTFGKVSDRIA